MRFYRKATILLSEDDSTSPKDIRFYDVERETLNRTALIEGGSGTNVIEPGDTFTLPMGQISLGKYCYLYSTGAFELVINGADKTFNMAARMQKLELLLFVFRGQRFLKMNPAAIRFLLKLEKIPLL